jgi:predicted glycoside hydrolase/deacetylase ChbG (UPF0249 family)
MSRPQLIVNADDLGMSIGITDGICMAHRYGLVTSASMMVNMPASDYALARLKACPQLGVGVHLNICQGKPVLPREAVSSLVSADGNFHSPAVMARKLWTWGVKQDELEAELRAQIWWLKDRTREITHADSHQHMHIYPAAAHAFARVVAEEEIACVRASRCTMWPHSGSAGGPHQGRLARRLLVQFYRGALQTFAFRRFISPASRIFFPGEAAKNEEELAQRSIEAFDRLPAQAFELACHPGLFEPGFSEADRIHSQRETELHWLTNPEVREAVERNGIELITYRDLCHVREESYSADRRALQRYVG